VKRKKKEIYFFLFFHSLLGFLFIYFFVLFLLLYNQRHTSCSSSFPPLPPIHPGISPPLFISQTHLTIVHFFYYQPPCSLDVQIFPPCYIYISILFLCCVCCCGMVLSPSLCVWCIKKKINLKLKICFPLCISLFFFIHFFCIYLYITFIETTERRTSSIVGK